MELNLDGFFTALIVLGAIVVGAIWGCWELYDYFFIEECIKSSTIITPEIRLEVNNNVVDTIYVYKVK